MSIEPLRDGVRQDHLVADLDDRRPVEDGDSRTDLLANARITTRSGDKAS